MDQNLLYQIRAEAERAAKRAVDEKLSSSFWDIFVQEMHFIRASENAVRSMLPGELHKQLYSSTGLVGDHVRRELPNALQPYVASNISDLQKQFREQIEQHKSSFQLILQNNKKELESFSANVIESEIKRISSSNAILTKIRSELQQQQQASFDSLKKDSERRISQLERSVFIANAIGITGLIVSGISLSGIALMCGGRTL